MHIPDGFLDLKTAAVTGVLAAAGLAFALWDARRTLPARKVPLLGLTAAFVFASQMLNFPVIGGTSGHLVGAVLTAALLGPSAAVIVLSAVLIVQCLMFADGGLTALGANILNMGLIGGVAGWMIYAAVSRLVKGLAGAIFAATVAAWASIVLAAVLCAGELAVSKTVAWNVAFPAMTLVHMLIGIGEAVITALVLSAIAAVRPELLRRSEGPVPVTRSLRPVLAFGVIVALGLALFASPFASTWPDGLDKAAEDLGFKARESTRALPAPIADYKIPGIASDAVATSIAGGLGTLVILGGSWLLTRTLVPKAKTPVPPPPST
jgi:cobalt/nickel transport system permease protein